MIIGVASADYQRPHLSPDGEQHWGGSGWARMGQYVDLWRAAGHEVHVGTLWAHTGTVKLGVDNLDSTHGQYYHDPDVFFMQRLMHPDLAEVMKMGRENGQVFVNDVDDWYWGLDPRNEAFHHSHPKNTDKYGLPGSIDSEGRFHFEPYLISKGNKGLNTTNYASILHASDHLTVSTPYLADRLRGKGIKVPMEVIPNYVDVDRFTPHLHRPCKPIVGWAGSTSHRSGDLAMLKGVLGQLQDEFQFQHSGHASWSPSFADEVGLPEDAVIRLDRVNAEHYPDLLNFDIGLIPLRDTPFNHAKSDIKGLEYAAAGIPFIASPSPSYTSLSAAWGAAASVAKRPGDYVRLIRSLKHSGRREELSEFLLEAVKARHITEGAKRTLEFIGTLGVE